MNFSLRFLTLLLALLATPLLHAQDAPTTESSWSLPDHATLLKIIPSPPAPGSAAEKADLDGVIAMQNSATAKVLAHAEKSVGFNVFSFSEVLGSDFTPATYPKTVEFFNHLEKTANDPKNFLKNSYRRIRPYRAFPDQVKILVTKEEGYSYPSGHSTRAWLFALVLGTLNPSHRADFLSSAMQVCQDRVIGGMHYPLDTLESRVLAEEIYQHLLEDRNFISDLATLHREEWMGKPAVKTP